MSNLFWDGSEQVGFTSVESKMKLTVLDRISPEQQAHKCIGHNTDIIAIIRKKEIPWSHMAKVGV